MSDVIPKPGKYKQQNGKPADVKWVGDGKALGFDQNGDSTCWHADTGMWVEAVQRPTYFLHITGPWLPDPPEPPAGFQVMPQEYVAKDGDLWTFRRGGWISPAGTGWIGKPADKIGVTTPAWLASPIPKPFSISEHGIGVYETRDGREATVTSNFGDGSTYPWLADLNGEAKCYTDGGRWTGLTEWPCDLVRYLRPLPKPTVDSPVAQSEWVPTNELRNRSLDLVGLVAQYKRENGMYSVYANGNWFSVVLEQKWTCGEKSEWRPIPVTTEGA